MINKMKPLLFSLIVFTGLLCCISFHDDSIHPFGTSITASAFSELNINNLYITKGDNYQLKVKNAKGKVKWSSEDKSIASVSSKGLVKAKKRGSTCIYVEDNTSYSYCYVTVETPKLSKSKITLIKGTSYSLNVKGTYRTVKWSSSDKRIAKVSKCGTVTARKSGTAEITALVGKHKYTCTVKVEAPKLSAKEMFLEPGKQAKISISGTTKKVKWSIEDNSVATISSDGTITAKKQGYTTITAKVSSAYYECDLSVEKPYLSDSSLVLLKDDWYELEVKDTFQDVKWSSSNVNVATVDKDGEVKAVNAGSCIISCNLGYKTLTCKVLVENPTISKSEIVLIEGQTEQLKLNGTTQKAKWSSSDTDVATVSDTGLVTAVKPGYTTIEATIGWDEYTCSVTVQDEPINVNQIEKTYYDTGSGIVGIFKNNYKKAVNIEMVVQYYNASGALIDKRSEKTRALKTGEEAAIKVIRPYDDNTWEDLDYSSYSVSLNVEKSGFDNSELGNDDFEYVETNTGNKLIVDITNKSKHDYTDVELSIVFFDSNMKCIGYESEYFDGFTAEKTDYVVFDYPYDKGSEEPIIPASYQIYLNYAY